MKSRRFMIFIAAIGMAVSAAASAQEAYTSRPANIRAGPEQDYPLVATLAPGTPVNIVGCIDGYRWCDVIAYDIRGWVSARSLQFTYDGRRVGVLEYGPTIGLPLIGFSLGYWDNYYRNRPFYRDRPRWERRWNEGPRYAPRYNDRPRIESRPQLREYNRQSSEPRGDRNYRPDRPQVAQPQYQRPQGQPPVRAVPQQPQVQQARPQPPRQAQQPPDAVRRGEISRAPPSREPGGN